MMDLIPSDVKRIIFAPLNWGLGHATRSIPLIKCLLDHDKEIILASDGEALMCLQHQFPSLHYIRLPGYNVSYKGDSLGHIIFSNAWNVYKAIRKEKKMADRILEDHDADLIISDSRFGFRSRKAPSIIISHQLSPLANTAILQSLIRMGNHHYLLKFDQIWVPDSPDRKLSGDLSLTNIKNKVRYIGPISRLKKVMANETMIDILIILSGPEPARTKLESQILKFARLSPKSIVLVRGTTLLKPINGMKHLRIINMADGETISRLLCSSKVVISRSGYTSLMDYDHLGIRAFLIPTPGQSEQEYLAQYHENRGHAHIKDLQQLVELF